MQVRYQIVIITLMSICIIVIGCGTKHCCQSEDFTEVLSGLHYVGELVTADSGPEIIVQSELPPTLEAGKRYVLHIDFKATTEEVALVLLPERLAHLGFKIISQPRSPDDFAVPDHGGSLWQIEIQKECCYARLYNRVHDTLYRSRDNWPAGSRDDYILEILE
jgi:hypothetical protein